MLRDRGLVEGQQGKGTFVADSAGNSSMG
ncbi:hypothetical protein [Micromonospora sp. NPDC005413]